MFLETWGLFAFNLGETLFLLSIGCFLHSQWLLFPVCEQHGVGGAPPILLHQNTVLYYNFQLCLQDLEPSACRVRCEVHTQYVSMSQKCYLGISGFRGFGGELPGALGELLWEGKRTFYHESYSNGVSAIYKV